jgi:hypothetical protein
MVMPRKDKTKVICLIFLFAALLWVFLTGNQAIRTTHAFSDGPPDGLTGAPGELTCTTCHLGEANTGPGKFMIVAPSMYEPGHTYQIRVEHMTTDATRRRWGFQLTALDGANRRAGELSNLSNLTQTLPGGPDGNRQYIEHGFISTFAGQAFQASWTFSWTAPSSDIGSVVFYAAGNQANNDGNSTGDQIYTTTAIVLSGPPEIDGASVRGKKLIIIGKNFADGATLFMDGSRVKKASNDSDNPTTLFTAKKAGKDIAPGQTVSLQIVNPDQSASNTFSFTRPLG